MRIGIYEDGHCHDLQPLIRLMPVFNLRCGILRIREKTELRLSSYPVDLYVRKKLLAVMQEQEPDRKINIFIPDDYLFINSRLLAKNEFYNKVHSLPKDSVLMVNEQPAAYRLQKSSLSNLAFNEEGLLVFPPLSTLRVIRNENPEDVMIRYAWDLITNNSAQIAEDFRLSPGMGFCEGQLYEGAYLLHPEHIYIARNTNIYPGVVISAADGPVYIGSEVTILPGSFLQGPLYIGDQTLVKAGSKIYGGTSIGPVCKVGGEIEGSILHSYSNKQHEGFLGHACLGQWVNLGADTNNSDLKNNYGKIRSYANGKEIDTGLRFLGLIMGDHCKSGINTMFNTGTVAGMMCNIFGSGFPPKYLPDFTWGGEQERIPYAIDKALETAKTVMLRRKQTLGPALESLIRLWYSDLVKD